MPPRIAVFTKNRTNPAYEAARIGADRTATRLGAVATHHVPRQPDNVPEQIALIERAIVERPDAVVFVPVRDRGERRHSRLRRRAHSVVQLHHAHDDRATGVLRRLGRSRLGGPHCALLFAKLCGRGQIVIVEGTPASATSRERLDGFHDALAEYPEIEVRLSLRGEYQRDVARAAAAGAIDEVRNADAILCANDAMALGVLDALEAVPDKRGLPLVVGVNAIPEAIATIAAGRMLATANFDAMTMSAIATEAAVRHLRGETVPREIILPVQVVDTANCSAWNLPFEARACPSWEEVTGRSSPKG